MASRLHGRPAALAQGGHALRDLNQLVGRVYTISTNRISLRRREEDGRLQVPAAALVMLATAILVPIGALSVDPAGRGLVVAIAAVLGALAPRRYLLAAAFVSYTVLPLNLFPELPAVAHPGYLAIWMWAFKAAAQRSRESESAQTRLSRAPEILCIGALLGWAVVITVVQGELNGIGWVLQFSVVALPLLLPTAMGHDLRQIAGFMTLWTCVLAMYTVLEFMRASNPLYESALQGLSIDLSTRWATYRSYGSFGHPLYAGTFFAVAAAAAFGEWLKSGRWYWVVTTGLAVGALVTTVSRGAAIAAGVGLLVAFVLQRSGSAGISRRVIALVGIAFAAATYIQTVWAERSGSVEATTSADARQRVVGIAWRVSGEGQHVGWGASSSQAAFREIGGSMLVLENSFLQILVSLGLPGLILFATLMLLVFRPAFRSRNAGAAGALSALVLAIAGYNAIEGIPTVCILLFFAFGYTCMSQSRQATAPDLERAPHAVG